MLFRVSESAQTCCDIHHLQCPQAKLAGHLQLDLDLCSRPSLHPRIPRLPQQDLQSLLTTTQMEGLLRELYGYVLRLYSRC